METVIVIIDSKSIKKTELLSGNKLKIFAPKKLNFKKAENNQFDTVVVIILPKDIVGYYCS